MTIMMFCTITYIRLEHFPLENYLCSVDSLHMMALIEFNSLIWFFEGGSNFSRFNFVGLSLRTICSCSFYNSIVSFMSQFLSGYADSFHVPHHMHSCCFLCQHFFCLLVISNVVYFFIYSSFKKKVLISYFLLNWYILWLV